MRREHKSESGGGGLPAGYQQLEYLQSTGTQSINTNLSVNTTKHKREIDFMWIDNSGGQCLFGAGNSNDTQWACTGYRGGYDLYFFIGSTAGTSTIANRCNISQNVRYNLIIEYNTQYHSLIRTFNGNAVTTSFSGNITSSPLSLFSSNNGGTVALGYKGRIYSAKLTNNDVLVRDFIPALRISDSKPGLYDLCGSICPLTNTPFYINAGTGEFSYA